jgi:ABC-2 type transport system ATP-binding protein
MVPQAHAEPEKAMPIIETRDLRKVFRTLVRRPGVAGTLRTLFSREYEDKVAVDGVTMAVDEGELVGYIGPNGAGKSTTIKMLTGILVPTAGLVRVAGLVPYEKRKENARNIGVVFGQRSQLYWDLPLVESFELLRAIYGIPAQRYRANLDHFVDVLAMAPFLKTPVRQLSLGQRMRGDFAASMLHDPRVVFLDEPTIGLDLVAKEAIREFIAQVNRERGTTFILTTHDLADVERLCRRIVLIDHGTIVYDGEIEALRDRYGTHRTLIVQLCEDAPDFAVEGAEIEWREGNIVRLRFDRRAISAEALIRQVADRYGVTDLSLEEPDLESIIRRIYTEGYDAAPTTARA